MEVWKAVKGYEGIYEVSDKGRVRSLDRIDAVGKNRSGRIIKGGVDKDGRRRVRLFNGSGKTYRVSQLVAMSFLGFDSNVNNSVVDHINNDPSNDSLDNLQVITHRNNLTKDKNGTSSYPGVHWNTRSKRWYSSIYIDGKQKHLGSFRDENNAGKAYIDALNSYRSSIMRNEKEGESYGSY